MNYKSYKYLIQVILLVKDTFFNDGAQLHLIFQTLFYTLKRLGDTENGNLKVCWPKNLILLFKLWII